MRADLPRGLQSAQIIHAAGTSSTGNLPEDTHAVSLVARDEVHLSLIAKRLRLAGVEFTTVREDVAPYFGQLMALGLRPRRKEEIRRHVSDLPKLK